MAPSVAPTRIRRLPPRRPGPRRHFVTARTVQGMARVRSGQAPAWPLVSDRSARRGSRIKHDFACTFAAPSTCVRCPAATVMLDAGGAGTYTQRAIPGSEPSQFFSPLAVIYGQVVIVLAGLVTDVDPASRLARVSLISVPYSWQWPVAASA